MKKLSDELRELLKQRLNRRINKCSQLGITARPELVGYRNGKAEEVEDLIKDLGEFYNKLDAKDEQVDRLQKELANQKATTLCYKHDVLDLKRDLETPGMNVLDKLMNEISRLKAENRQLTKEREQLRFERDALVESLGTMRKNGEDLINKMVAQGFKP